MVRKTKEEAQATRSALLDAAELLFHARGVSRTSLNDIAIAAGVTRGAIYWHFTDKADLFDAMMRRVALPIENVVCQCSANSPDDPLGQVRRSFIGALSVAAENPQVRRVFSIAMHKMEYVDEMRVVGDRRQTARLECLASVEDAFALASRRGQVGPGLSPRSAALGLHALLDGLLQNWLPDQAAFDVVEVGRQVIDAYLAGVCASVAAPTGQCIKVTPSGT
jgi:TetR/AcrR family acrAB operon transcriptional repressor